MKETLTEYLATEYVDQIEQDHLMNLYNKLLSAKVRYRRRQTKDNHQAVQLARANFEAEVERMSVDFSEE